MSSAKFAECINIQKSTTFLYTNKENAETKIKNKTSWTTALKSEIL